jgi:hypothetical protein
MPAATTRAKARRPAFIGTTLTISLAQHFRQLMGYQQKTLRGKEARAQARLPETADVAAARSFARTRERKRLAAVHACSEPRRC